LVLPEDDNDPEEVLQTAMLSMYNVIGLDVIDIDSPFDSLFITKPSSTTTMNGVDHGGGSKFYDISDQAYQDYRVWLELYTSCYQGMESQLPKISLDLPHHKKKFLLGTPISFGAEVHDLQDGDLDGESVVWTSNAMDVPIGYGTGLFQEELPLGKHMITLTATDSDGNQNDWTVKIWVKEEL